MDSRSRPDETQRLDLHPGVPRSPTKNVLLGRRRNVLMHDEPLSTLILENHGPAPGPHLAFSVALDGVFFHGCRTPAQISVLMKLSIVVHSEFGALEAFQDWLYPLLILIPTAVFERGDIEKRVWTFSIKLLHVRGVQRRPAVPDFLHVGFVGRGCVRHRFF